MWFQYLIFAGVLVMCFAVSWLTSPPPDEGHDDGQFFRDDAAGSPAGWVAAGGLIGPEEGIAEDGVTASGFAPIEAEVIQDAEAPAEAACPTPAVGPGL